MTVTDAPSTGIPAMPRPGRRQMARAVKINVWLDASLLVAFIATQAVSVTGLVVHESVGVLLGLALLIHLTLHWSWVVRTTRHLFTRRPGRDTLRWVNNVALLVTMTLCVMSGLLSSKVVLPVIGIFTGRSAFWLDVHLRTADLSLFFVGLHVALSWRWVTVIVRRARPRHHRANRTRAS